MVAVAVKYMNNCSFMGFVAGCQHESDAALHVKNGVLFPECSLWEKGS